MHRAQDSFGVDLTDSRGEPIWLLEEANGRISMVGASKEYPGPFLRDTYGKHVLDSKNETIFWINTVPGRQQFHSIFDKPICKNFGSFSSCPASNSEIKNNI